MISQPEVAELVVSLATGLAAGFLVSTPIGPINITIINDGARHGFLRAWLVGLGAMSMDVIYCSIGLAGFSQLFSSRWLNAAMELVSFLLLLYLGWKYLRAKAIAVTSKSADAVEHRLHPHTAYMIGFVRVLGNPAVLVLWITLSATFVSHEWVDPNLLSKALCVVGVGFGATTWFTLLSYGVSRGHGRFSPRTLLGMSHVSGACLLTGALIIAVRLIRLLARH